MQSTLYSLNKNLITQFFNETDLSIFKNFDSCFEKLFSDLEISRGLFSIISIKITIHLQRDQ